MSRIIAAVACALVAWDCADKAAGIAPQALFNDANLWVWWLGAAGWALNTVLIAARGAP